MDYSIAAGTVIGGRHLNEGKANQDSFIYSKEEDYLIGIVCDGCGSSKYSTVGANFGCMSMVSMIKSLLDNDIETNFKKAFPAIEAQLVDNIAVSAKKIDGGFVDVIMDYFLFTTMGFIMTPQKTTIFYVGDGVYFVNGIEHVIGPYPNNAPPFVAYQLVNNFLARPRHDLNFVTQVYDTDHVHSLLIGTDGVTDLMQASEEPIPNTNDKIGDISQFWSKPRYFKNQGIDPPISKQLILINQDGLLTDDTTMVTVKKG